MEKDEGMNGARTHILLVEDNPGDARILRELLAEGNADRFTLTHVDRLDTGIRCLDQSAIHIILLDLSLPDSQGAETLARMHAAAKGIPIVLMTGLEDEELGLRLIQAGAHDYLVKGQVTAPLLTRALTYAVERTRLERELREQTRLLQSVLHSMADGVVMADEAGTFQVWNPAAERIMGTGPANVGIGGWSDHYGLFLPDNVTPYPPHDLPLARAIRGESVTNVLVCLRSPAHPDGAWLSVNARPLRDETGQLKGGVAVFRDITGTKRTDEALRESQERYRLLVTKANDIIYRTDAMGRFTFVNPVAMRIMKYSERELLERRFVDLIHPDYQAAAERFYGRQFIRQQSSTYYEFLALAKDGREVWIGQNVQVLLQDSKVIGFQAVARDITERRRIQAALSASEERFRSLVSNLPGAVYRCACDPDWTMEFLSDPIKHLCGYPASDFLANHVRSYASVIYPDDLPMVERTVLGAVAQRQPFSIEYRLLHKDGGIRWVYEKGQGVFAADGKLLCLDGAIFDITDRKRTEEALLESEERSRSIVQSTSDAIILMDIEGRVAFWNSGAEQTFGYTADEMVGQPMTRIIPDRFREAHQRGVQRVAVTGRLTVRATMFELAGLRKDGTEFPLEFSLAAWTAKSKLFITGIIRDISERKQAEEERQKLAKERLLLLDSTGDGIYGIDPEGRCTFINRAGAKMLGYEPAEVMGKNMHRLIHHSLPDGSPYPITQCHIYEVLHSGRGCHIDDEVFWRKDGTAFPADYSSFPVFEQDRITGAVVTFIDITVRKRLEQERSQRALRLIKQQSALTGLTRSRVFQSSELMQTLQRITEMAARTLNIERVGIWRYTDDRSGIHCIDRYELTNDRHVNGLTIPIASRPAYFQTLSTLQMIVIDDVRADDRTAQLYDDLSGYDVASRMDIPLYLFGRLMGVICYEHTGTARQWMEDEWMFAIAVSNLVALAYEEDERKRAETQLQQSQERLRSLTGRLESIQEEERIRIAREVHDELGQALTGVKLELVFLRDHLRNLQPDVLDRVESIVKLVDRTMQSVRKIATELRPVVLDQLGLIPAIEWQAREFQNRTGISCKLNFYLRTVALPVDRATGVFRIFQEILTNVVRHAQASRVDISMQEHMGHLLVTVTDNGRGITEDEVSGSQSLGLLGMRERALLLGGETKIERNLEQGTTVTVRVPLDRSQPE
jgi:PAS domain S-box-containing protein